MVSGFGLANVKRSKLYEQRGKITVMNEKDKKTIIPIFFGVFIYLLVVKNIFSQNYF